MLSPGMTGMHAIGAILSVPATGRQLNASDRTHIHLALALATYLKRYGIRADVNIISPSG